MAPSSFKKAYGETQSSSMDVSGTMVRSLHALPSPLEEKFPQLPDSPNVFSSDSGCPTRIHYSPMSPNTSGSISSTVYSLSPRDGASFLANQHPYSVMQSTQLDGYAMVNNDVSWNEIERFLDTSIKIPDQDGRIETSTEDPAKKSNWQDWAEQLISVNDETLNSNWSDLLVDGNLPDSEPKPHNASLQQPHIQQLQPRPMPSVNGCPELASPTAPSSKARMRWTPELHEAFVEAVNKLGGSDKATPKGVLKIMNVEGLTIYNVKSHLQKYRTARYKPESPEGTPEKKLKTTGDMTSLDLKATVGITEALRLQMEVQKQLHDQLEIQRNLQIRIEEQGKRLQEMFEQQRELEKVKGKTPSLKADKSRTQPCLGNDKPESSQNSPVCMKELKADACLSADNEKHAPCSPPSRRTKVSETGSPHES